MKRTIPFYILVLLFSIVDNQLLSAQSYDNPSPRIRVIIDNDFAGDPDGVVALAHHLMSPSVDIRAVISSYFPMKASPYGNKSEKEGAKIGKAIAKETISVIAPDKNILLLQGSNTPMENVNTPSESEGTDFIIKEAMRTDTKQRLYVCCGGSLNTIASAYLKNPGIAEKLTLIWIGGEENLGEMQIMPPRKSKVEYNLALDKCAAQVIFNKSRLNLWMIPRPAYRQCIYGYSEILSKIKPMGVIGKFLFEKINTWYDNTHSWCGGTAETYILGDSPLVLLTALQSIYEADPSSSQYVLRPCPTINNDGNFTDNPSGNIIRIYTHPDTRLMFSDMEAKLYLHNSEQKKRLKK